MKLTGIIHKPHVMTRLDSGGQRSRSQQAVEVAEASTSMLMDYPVKSHLSGGMLWSTYGGVAGIQRHYFTYSGIFSGTVFRQNLNFSDWVQCRLLLSLLVNEVYKNSQVTDPPRLYL